MTRINLVPVEELYDQHLMAEYREIFMVGSSLQRSLKSKNWPTNKQKIPKHFTLNKGHVSFFYDKGLYLYNRYQQLTRELTNRGFNLDQSRVFKTEQWPTDLYNDWMPREIDMAIVRERINIRISQRPSWYRKTVKGTT